MSTTPDMSSTPEQRISATREELSETLDAIEDRMNVPRQFDRLRAKAKTSYDENPIPWVIGATAAIIIVGGIIAWSIFSDD